MKDRFCLFAPLLGAALFLSSPTFAQSSQVYVAPEEGESTEIVVNPDDVNIKTDDEEVTVHGNEVKIKENK